MVVVNGNVYHKSISDLGIDVLNHQLLKLYSPRSCTYPPLQVMQTTLVRSAPANASKQPRDMYTVPLDSPTPTSCRPLHQVAKPLLPRTRPNTRSCAQSTPVPERNSLSLSQAARAIALLPKTQTTSLVLLQRPLNAKL